MFLLTCLLRGMTCHFDIGYLSDTFLLTCLLRGMTYYFCEIFHIFSVSTHMPLARHDLASKFASSRLDVSTHMPLARHDKGQPLHASFNALFLLTCLLRGMTCEALRNGIRYACVSTHMPLARHDDFEKIWDVLGWVSTHMPLARHDSLLVLEVSAHYKFLLTCLLRGMTQSQNIYSFISRFYSHASCEA